MGWIAVIFELSGKYLVGRKNKFGFLLSATCSIFWIIVGITTQIWALLAIAVVCFGMNLWNFRKWGKNSEKKT